MTEVSYFDPKTLAKPYGFRHAAAASGEKFAFCAGQVALDEQGHVCGVGDHTAQARRAMLNVVTALKSAGASAQSIVKMTVYVVGLGNQENQKKVFDGLRQATKEAGIHPAPSTMIGVEALMTNDLLIEIDAIAVAENG